MKRRCGSCTLCCKLLPLREFGKDAGVRCKHQRHNVGCAIYDRKPLSCMLWSCRWLVGEDVADLPRPDRVGYVLDIMPDFITVQDNESGEEVNVQVVQVWVDPARHDAHRDPHLRDYLLRRARENTAALIRYGSEGDAFVLLAPPMTSSDEWVEVGSKTCGREHDILEIAKALDSQIFIGIERQ